MNWRRIADDEPTRVKGAFFLVWGSHNPELCFPYEAERFWNARDPKFPSHLSSRCFTHWRPMTLPTDEGECGV